MKKKVTKFGSREIYLLGENKDGEYIYMDKAEWFCGWYWSFGILHSYTNNRCPDKSEDINCMYHVSNYQNGNRNLYDAIKEDFAELVLTDKELWCFCDYMKSFYTLRAAAEVMSMGYSHYTEAVFLKEVKNEEMQKQINEIMIPAIIKQVEELLGGNRNEN